MAPASPRRPRWQGATSDAAPDADEAQAPANSATPIARLGKLRSVELGNVSVHVAQDHGNVQHRSGHGRPRGRELPGAPWVQAMGGGHAVLESERRTGSLLRIAQPQQRRPRFGGESLGGPHGRAPTLSPAPLSLAHATAHSAKQRSTLAVCPSPGRRAVSAWASSWALMGSAGAADYHTRGPPTPPAQCVGSFPRRDLAAPIAVGAF